MSAAELVYFCYEAIQKVAVVAYDDYCAVEVAYSVFKHVFRAHIQVIGRLIEYQEVYRLQEQLYHGESATLAAREHFHFFV